MAGPCWPLDAGWLVTSALALGPGLVAAQFFTRFLSWSRALASLSLSSIPYSSSSTLPFALSLGIIHLCFFAISTSSSPLPLGTLRSKDRSYFPLSRSGPAVPAPILAPWTLFVIRAPSNHYQPLADSPSRFRPQQHHISSRPDPITKSMPISFVLKTVSISVHNLSEPHNSGSDDSLNHFAHVAQRPL